VSIVRNPLDLGETTPINMASNLGSGSGCQSAPLPPTASVTYWL
jgi:hypothetical protein